MNSHALPRAMWSRGIFVLSAALIFAAPLFMPALRLRAAPAGDLALSISRAQRPVGEVAVLTWQSAPGTQYKVQYRASLSGAAAWNDFDVLLATGATTTAEVPLSLLGSATPDRGFFRLALPPPTIAGLEPALLHTGGGPIHLSAYGLEPGDLVRIGGLNLAANFLSETLLMVTVPPFAAGIYDVEIVRSGNVIASLPASLRVTSGLALEPLEPPALPPGAPACQTAAPLANGCIASRVASIWKGSAYPTIDGGIVGMSGGMGGTYLKAFRQNARTAWMDAATGEARAMSVDLTVPGRGLDFVWVTTFRSRNGDPLSAMGSHWSHSYDIRCAQNGADLEVWDGTGRHDTFFLQPDGSFSRRGFFRRGTLAGLAFTLEFADKGRWEFRPLDGSPASGKIARSFDRNGNQLQFNYDGAGRLSQIIDTLGRLFTVQYDTNGRVSTVSDFSGRMVRYLYYGLGDPNGADGALMSIRSPVVNGTPTGNNFPTGKRTTFTYSTGFADPRLNDNLLTITDPKGQTSRRFTYAATLNPNDLKFDRVVSMQCGDQTDPKDKASVFTWIEQTPSPANGFARVKLIANDPVGNVTTQLFESRNLCVAHLAHTGRATPGIAVTETTNLPAGQLRPGDPNSFTTTAAWNLNFLPTRITLPRGDGREFVWESDFNATASTREAGNLRTLREVGLAGETLDWRMQHEPGFGTGERGFAALAGVGSVGSTGGDGAMPMPVLPQPPSPKPPHPGGCMGGPYETPSSTTPHPGSSMGSPAETDLWQPLPFMPPTDPAPAPRFTSLSDVMRIFLNRTDPVFRGELSEESDLRPWGEDHLRMEDFRRGDLQTPVEPQGAEPVPEGPHVDSPFEEKDRIIGCIGPETFSNSLTDPRGFTTTLAHDIAGNITQVQWPVAGAVENFTYNAFGQPTSHVHPANGSGHARVDTFSYHNAGSQNGYLASVVVDAGGLNLTTAFEWNNRGALVRMVDARGNDWLRTRNQLDQVVRTSSPMVNGARNERDFIYDANDNLERIDIQNRDENGALGANTHLSRTWSFDFRNRPTQRVDEIDAVTARTTLFSYDGNRDLTQLTLPEAASGADPKSIVRFEYDERRRPFRTIRAPGAAVQSTTQCDYGLNGRLTAHRQGLESAPRVMTFAYDEHDRCVGRTDAAGNVIAFTLDQCGDVTHCSITGNAAPLPAPPQLLWSASLTRNPLHSVTSTHVRYVDLLTITDLGDGARTTSYPRAPNQQVMSMTDDNAHTTSFTHDTANRLARVTDARGNRLDLTRDANGNRIAALLTDKRDSGAPDEQFQTISAYDALNRPISAQDNAGNTTNGQYDSRGNLTRATDPRGTVTLFQYDGLSRLTRRVEDLDATGTETAPDISRSFQYDRDSRLTLIIDDNGNTTQYQYDSLNRPKGTQHADATTDSVSYDVHDNVIASQDANGTVILRTYDMLNRLTNKTITPGAGVASTTTFETFDYDGMSRLLRAANDISSVAFTYDSLGHRRSETAGGLTTSATFDAVGRRLSLTYPGGRALVFTHDVLDRVTAVNEGAFTLGAFLHAGRDHLERASFGNGTRLDIAYDGALGTIPAAGDFGWRKTVFMQHARVAGGAVIHDLSMRWDRSQNKTARLQLTPFMPGGATQARTFDYDAADRLIHSHFTFSNGPVFDTQYQLDGEGNRVQVIGSSNPGAYTRSATTPAPADFQVDQYTATPFDTRQYDDNGNLRLTQATAPAGLTRTMAFDYANRLVSVILNGGFQIQYRYDALGRRITKIVQPPGPPIVITTRFAYDGHRVIEERDGGGAVLASWWGGGMRRGGQDYWLHADAAGDVFALTNASGAVVERYDYDHFGEAQFLDLAGNPLPGVTQSSAGNPHLFHSLRYEHEPRFYLGGGGRHWDPQAARSIGPPPQNEEPFYFGDDPFGVDVLHPVKGRDGWRYWPRGETDFGPDPFGLHVLEPLPYDASIEFGPSPFVDRILEGIRWREERGTPWWEYFDFGPDPFLQKPIQPMWHPEFGSDPFGQSIH